MDQTRGIDKDKALEDQFIEILDKRYMVEETILGGRFQLHKKVAAGLKALAMDYFYRHPEELKPYVYE